MRAELRTALPDDDVRRKLESLADHRAIGVAALAEFLKAPFIECSQGKLSFAHSNFQAFFRAESLLRSDLDLEQLSVQAHQDPDSAKLLLPMLSEPRAVRAVLTGLGIRSGLSDGKEFRDDAVLDALGGQYGGEVQSLVEADLATLFERELTRVRSVRFLGPLNLDGLKKVFDPNFSFETELAPYERCLFAHLASTAPFAPVLRRDAGQLIDATLESVTDVACAKLATSAVKVSRDRVRALLLWRLLTLRRETGAGLLCSVSAFIRRMTEAETVDLLKHMEEGGLGNFYWGLKLLASVGARCDASQAALPQLLRRAKASAVAQVIHGALELPRYFSRGATGPLRDEILAILNSFEPGNNVFIGNLVLEGLDVIGEDLGFSVERITQQIGSLLESTGDASACAEAAEIYGWQFEPIGGEEHSTAIGALTGAARAKFLAMAAMGSVETSTGLVPLLSELVGCTEAGSEPLAIAAFRKWAVAVNREGPFFEYSLAWVVRANAALAWFGREPVAPVGPQSSESEVSFLVAELVFLSAKGESSSSRCSTVWQRLQVLATVAADTVCRVAMVHPVYLDEPPKRQWPSFVVDFHDELREFLHRALKQHDELVSPIPGHEISKQVVALLGAIGNAESRRLLLALRDDQSLGEVASMAARKIP